jgi:hypothetical protein
VARRNQVKQKVVRKTKVMFYEGVEGKKKKRKMFAGRTGKFEKRGRGGGTGSSYGSGSGSRCRGEAKG